jgi:hypothetical protein
MCSRLKSFHRLEHANFALGYWCVLNLLACCKVTLIILWYDGTATVDGGASVAFESDFIDIDEEGVITADESDNQWELSFEASVTSLKVNGIAGRRIVKSVEEKG